MTKDEWIAQAALAFRGHGYAEPEDAARAMFEAIREILEDDTALLALDPDQEAQRSVDLAKLETENPSSDLDGPDGPDFAD